MNPLADYTVEEYLKYTDEQLDTSRLQVDYPNIWEYYNELCVSFKSLCQEKEVETLHQLRELLRIDAQFQIMKTFFLDDPAHDFSMFTEKDLLAMICEDKDSYYRELTGFRNNDRPPLGLIYLSEK